MNRLTSLIIFVLLPVFSFSQDHISLQNGSILNARVIGMDPSFVTYTFPEDSLGTKYTVPRNEVVRILFSTIPNKHLLSKKHPKQDRYFSAGKNDYNSMASGFGQSYGFPGIRYQRRVGDLLGIGFNAGLGVSPFGVHENLGGIWCSTGIKFFWYKGWYLGFQVGTVPATRLLYQEDSVRPKEPVTETRLSLGPSILLGGDFLFNRHWGMNIALGASLNMLRESYNPAVFMFDFGIIYKFSRSYRSDPKKAKP